MKVFILAVLGIIIVTPLVQAEPKIINVPGDYTTIQAAINAAANTDIVLVAPGTYTENINFSGKKITVTSLNPEDPCVVAGTVIDGNGSGTVVTFDNSETSEAVLTGFTITGGTGTYVGKDGSISQYLGGGICCIQSSPTIVGNVITVNHGSTTTTVNSYGGAIGCIQGQPNISRNIIKDNTATAGAGIIVVEGNAQIVSNLIYENSALTAGGIFLLFGGQFVGNTIFANEADVAGNVYLVGSSGLLSSNIIADAVNGGGIYAEPEASDLIRYNNVFNNNPGNYSSATDFTGSNGNISADPCFADAAAYDFHLNPDSPCINAGQPGVGAAVDANDIDGQDRIFAVIIDMGADEYVGYLPPVAVAGPDQMLEGIQPVTLDGSGSFFYDPNGTKEFYWQQIAGEPVTLSDPYAMQPTFTPDVEDRYKFELTVSDGLNTSEPDEVLVVIGEYVMLAFPGAEGSGRRATGGRGGSVYKVTNLNNSGPGSIVDALSVGNRTVVFDVSGTIELDGVILQPKSNTTIAGQTAPGDGICIKGRIYIGDVHDVVIRYIRVRVDEGGANSDGDAVDIHMGQNIIIDHVSASYARDEGISCREDSNNITVQWCIISEGLTYEGHSYGSLVRGQYGQKKTYHHNLYAHNSGRNPRPGNYEYYTKDSEGLHFDFRNNVMYNWKGNTAGYNDDITAVSRYNFVGNAYITGPESSVTGLGFREKTRYAYGYFEDNSYNGVVPGDPWSIVQFSSMTDDHITAYKARSYIVPMEPVTTTSPAQAKIDVLAGAGASFPVRDIIDTRIANDVINGTGHSIRDTSQQPEGAWPDLNSLPAPEDYDHDGMPDYWELGVCLDPCDANDSNGDRDNDGYTNLEEYINWLPTGEPMPPCMNRPPVAIAGPNQIAYAWLDGFADVTLDGSASYDDDNDVLDYYWSWEIDSNVFEANGVSPVIQLPVGEHQIELIVDDGYFLSEPNYCTISVIEPMQTSLFCTPRVLNVKSRGRFIMAFITMPEGITPEDINDAEPLILLPGNIEAKRQFVWQSRSWRCRRYPRTYITAIFDKSDCMENLSPGQNRVNVGGRLTSGRFFYGTDNLRVIQWRPWLWRHRRK